MSDYREICLIITFIIFMKDQSSIFGTIKSVVLLAIVIATPLMICYNYETYKFNLESTEGYLERINLLQEKIVQTQANRSTIRQQFKLDKPKYQEEVSQIQRKIVNNDWRAGRSNHVKIDIINVQITSSYWSDRHEIMNNVRKSINLINRSLKMGLQVVEWIDGMSLNLTKSATILMMRQLKQQYIEQNIASRLKKGDFKDQYYLKDVLRELTEISSFSHCKFSSMDCTHNTLLFVNHPQSKRNSYWKLGSGLYILDEIKPAITYNALAEVFSVYEILILQQAYQLDGELLLKRAQEEAFIVETKRILSYLRHIFEDKEFQFQKRYEGWIKKPETMVSFIKNGEYTSSYRHDEAQMLLINQLLQKIQGNLLNDERQQIIHNPLSDSRVGVFKFFPNDFKIGVYLPLLVLFIKPIFDKLSQIISSMVGLVRKRLSKEDPEAKKTD